MKSSAGADGALDVNLAGVFLDDAVGDGKAQPDAAAVAGPRRGFGGEEGIVDALEMLRSDAAAGVCYLRGHGAWVTVDQRCYAQVASAGHCFLGIQQQIEKDLLQLARVSVNERKIFGQVEIDGDLRGFELVLEQGERVANDLVQVGFTERGGRGAGA